MNRGYSILFTLWIILFSLDLYAQENKLDTIHKWYRPTHVQLQFAGNIGMFSTGVSWSLLKNNMEVRYSIGYVPESVADINIYVTSSKVIYTPPININVKKNIQFKPLAVGVITSHTLGKKYQQYEKTNRYPRGYYWWNVPFRNALLHNLEIHVKTDHKPIKGISLYLETSFWDVYLISVFSNSNTSVLNLWEATTFGVGGKLFF